MAFPNKKVLSINGDAGFLMNVQDLETAVRNRINVVAVVWLDGEYGLIKWKQQAQFGKSTDLDFNNPNWEKLAKSFDWNYIFEDNSSKITKSLEKTNNLKGPTLFVIPIDYSENGKLTKFLDDLEKKYDT